MREEKQKNSKEKNEKIQLNNSGLYNKSSKPHVK